MNFLQLAQRVRQEAGIAGTGPSAVTSQTGESRRIVDWVNAAWIDVQQDRPDWQWMRGSFTLPLVAADAEYSATDASLTDMRSWRTRTLKVYTTSTADEQELEYIPYDRFRREYMVGTASTGRPYCFTVKPDKTLRFFPTPAASYTVYGEYQKSASEMAANTDEPGLPDEFHMMIVYRALMKYARFEAAPEIYEDAKAEYKRMRNALALEQLEELEFAGPLV